MLIRILFNKHVIFKPKTNYNKNNLNLSAYGNPILFRQTIKY